MALFRTIWSGLKGLSRGKRLNQDMDEELDSYLDSAAEDKMRSGMRHAEALREARLEMGSTEAVKQRVWSVGWESIVENFWTDVRYGVRQLRKSPGFATVAVITLALGIGANTAIFSLIDAALLKVLPVRNPEQLRQFNSRIPGFGINDVFPYPAFKHFRDESDAFSGVFAFATIRNVNFEVGGQGGTANGQVVSGEYFSTLGVKAMLGRTILRQDDVVPGGSAVVVIGYDYWRTRLASDADIVGKEVVLNNYPFTVIGVTPPEFFGLQPGDRVDLSIPITMIAQVRPEYAATGTAYDVMSSTFRNWLHVMGRLGPGMTSEGAVAHTELPFRKAMDQGAESLAVTPLNSPVEQRAYRQAKLQLTAGGQGLAVLRQQYSRPLTILMCGVALLLLITCANVASLLLARANARQHEMVARLVLGASRGRLIEQLITENGLLALGGGALGMILAWRASTSLMALVAHGRSPIVLSVRPDTTVLGFTLAVSILTTFLFGLIPAWRAARIELPSSLVQSTRSVGKGVGRSRLGKSLIILQVAVSLILIIGAGLLVRSLRNLKDFYPGFNKENLLLLSINPGMVGYKKPEADAFYRRLVDRISALPGVRGTTFSMSAPISGDSSFIVPNVEGYKPPSGRESVSAGMNVVGPHYFSTLETPIVLGRDFTSADETGTPKVAIIDQTMARSCYGDTNPIGRRINMPGWVGDTSWFQIVGVVADAKSHDLREQPVSMVYVPLYQSAVPSGVSFEIRTYKNPATVTTAVLHAIAEADSRLPVFNVRTLVEQIDDSLVEERLVAYLSGIFGLLAVTLACVGLYGLMAYAVNRRTNEIGLRIALGAKREQILSMILGESLLLVATGLAIGIPSALGASRLIRSELYGLRPNDLATMLIAGAVMVGIGIIAGYLPARRASHVDPMVALRYE